MAMPGTVAPGMKRTRRGCAGPPASSAGSTASMVTPSGILSSRVKPGSLEYRAIRPSWGKMTTSTGCWWRSARFTAALRKVATESQADTRRTLSSPAEAAGKLRPTIRAMIATTTTISTRVTPRRGCLLVFPTDNVGIDPFAAGLAVGAEADDLRFVGLMFAGEAVDEVAGPGILGDVLGHVGAVPLVDVRRLDAQRLQTLLGGGE